MHLIAGIDEFATATQVSEGWTYSVFPPASVSAIDGAVSRCAVQDFHGSQFVPSQATDYEALLAAARLELARCPEALLTFTLLDVSWKNTFVDFGSRLISNAFQLGGISDPSAVGIAEHLFPGLITLQRLTSAISGATVDIEIDSDSVSRPLATSQVSVGSRSCSTAKLLGRAYEAHRTRQFPGSPQLGAGGIKALEDAQSRAIQVADVFGNFALSYIFVQLGRSSYTRATKAGILQRVFAELTPGSVTQAAKLCGPKSDDIQLLHADGLSFAIGI